MLIVAGVALFGSPACGGDSTSPTDAGVDGGTDAGVDAGSDGGQEQPPLEVSVTLDENVQPQRQQVAGPEEWGPRRLAAVADGEDAVSSFVVDELVLVYEEQDELDAFVDRSGKSVLFQVEPGAADPEAPGMALVRVSTAGQAVSALEEDLAAVDRAAGIFGRAELRVSSEEGMRLLALALSEMRHGATVGVNFVMAPDTIPGSTEEAPDPDNPGVYGDAYQWDRWTREGPLEIGVPGAWNLLYYAGKLNRTVRVAVLDQGFTANDDFQRWSSTHVYGGSGMDQAGSGDSPWHGTWVASILMAQLDNRFGWAGVAGPVAHGVFIHTPYDAATANLALYKASSRNARIINMSFSGRVHHTLKPALRYFRDHTDRLRDRGVLLFGSAGNDGRNVDREKCIQGTDWCWETHFHYPCENAGVYCVGGTNASGGRHPDSNYGNQSVDIWAPYEVLVGPDPDDQGQNLRQGMQGTSFSSPFVAGVAALVWAADPALSRSQVADLLLSTAHPHGEYNRVNAFDAVLQAVGAGFAARITSPADGARLTAGIPLTLMAELTAIGAPGSGVVPVAVEWYSSPGGLVHQEQVEVPLDEIDGYNLAQSSWTGVLADDVYAITLITRADVTPEGWGGQEVIVDQDMVAVEVVNPPPEVTILQPEPGYYCPGQVLTFRASAQDPNESLPDEAFLWITNPASDPLHLRILGEAPTVTASGFPPGEHQVLVRVTDSRGVQGEDSGSFNILSAVHPDCSDLPPQATIGFPAEGDRFQVDGHDGTGNYKDLTLQATATDPEDDDGTLLLEWFSDTDGKLGEGHDLDARIHMTEQCAQDITIRLEVTDSDQNMTPDEVTINLWYVCK